MPRNGSNVFSAPTGTTATSGTTIESAKYNAFVNDLVSLANEARPIVAGGTGATTAAGVRDNLGVSGKVLSKSANYTVTTSDRDKLIRGTSTLTLSLPAAATAGDGFVFHVKGDGAVVTVDPNGAETIDGSATYDVEDAASATIRCNGSAWFVQSGGAAAEADAYRLTANVTTDGVIAANWERPDDASAGYVGSGVTEASGVFSFPSTGVWRIDATASIEAINGDSVQGLLEATINNGSAWDTVTTLTQKGAGGTQFGNVASFCLVDVTDVSNVKIRFSASSISSGSSIFGDTDRNLTALIFQRVGDT